MKVSAGHVYATHYSVVILQLLRQSHPPSRHRILFPEDAYMYCRLSAVHAPDNQADGFSRSSARCTDSLS